jgi:deoxyadenosine/deoxycytidine kinase
MSKIFSIEGNIGSGKSTLVRSLKEYYSNSSSIIFLEEPVDEWNKIVDKNGMTMLAKFYENQEKYSFAFQMMAYISRLSLLKQAIEKYPEAIIITERCLNTDRYVFAKMLYDSQKIEDIEYQIYLKWFDEFSNIIPIQKIIYLKTSPEICFYRMNKRNREGESNIKIDYLKTCHEYHEEMIQKMYENTLIIDSNIDIHDNKNNDENIVNKWILCIEKFIQ